MFNKLLRLTLTLAASGMLLLLLACGSSSSTQSNNNNNNSPQNGRLSVVISDDPSEDWATIGVKVASISLTPQGGGSPVVVFTAPNPAPVLNLVQLDQLGELLANAQVPAGTYTGATLSLSANPGDVTLVVSADPEPGFAGT